MLRPLLLTEERDDDMPSESQFIRSLVLYQRPYEGLHGIEQVQSNSSPARGEEWRYASFRDCESF